MVERDKYKDFSLSMEEEKDQLQSNYEKDKILWEGKFNFLT